MIYSGTGHRVPKLGLDYSDKSNDILRKFLFDEILNLKDISKGISGGATGFDQAYAEALILLRIPYIIALPFKDMGSNWPIDGRKRLDYIIQKSESIKYLSEENYKGKQDNYLYILRDHWMVDNGDKVFCLYDENETKGGTFATISYAKKQNKRIVNCWDNFQNIIKI